VPSGVYITKSLVSGAGLVQLNLEIFVEKETLLFSLLNI
jgi:hypothetical protein